MLKERIESIKNEIENLKIRSSATSRMMAYPNKNELSVGAKTYIEEIVDQIVYDFKSSISSKQTEKGNTVEDASIELYNKVFFKDYKKATQSASNEYMKTEGCDIDDDVDDKIIDIKSPWTKKTMPKTVRKATESAKKSGYDWQLMSYMSIFKRKFGEVAYCFSETPEDLCQYEDQSLHTNNVEMTPEDLLITRVQYQFDAVKEAQIIAKVKLGRIYALEYFNEILKDHGIN